MADLQIPASTAIFKWARPKRAMAELSEAAEDALMEKDRFKIVPIQGLPSLRDASTDVVAGNHDRCACRKLNPGISVMESAQDWATKNVPGAIDGARDRCILFQG
jgi:hypothetical protein